MCLMGDSDVGVCGRGGCTGMVALANGVDVVGCASVEGPVISSEVTRRSWDMLSVWSVYSQPHTCALTVCGPLHALTGLLL